MLCFLFLFLGLLDFEIEVENEIKTVEFVGFLNCKMTIERRGWT